MKIAFLINQTHKEKASFTTTLLALKCLRRGHDIYYIGLADFYYEKESISAHVRHVSADSPIDDPTVLMETLRSTPKKRMDLRQLNILWLRFDPVLDMINRPWAAPAGLQFAELLKKMGVYVINNPTALAQASNKLYLENFDETIRPKTLVTRQYEDVLAFYQQQDEHIILKPLKGSGGKNVFLIDKNNTQNMKQIVEAIGRDGYVIAQEYLPEAVKGDIRFFLLDGKPIIVNNEYAAVQRVQKENEIRSNVHQGGTVQAAYIDKNILEVVSKVADQLVKDGMYFVGLDIVGDKIMEINVFSPGALPQAERLCHADFSTAIIEQLEVKVAENKIS